MSFIALGDLNFDDSLCNSPNYYREIYIVKQLITEKISARHQSESTIDVILTHHPELHKKSVAPFTNMV